MSPRGFVGAHLPVCAECGQVPGLERNLAEWKEAASEIAGERNFLRARSRAWKRLATETIARSRGATAALVAECDRLEDENKQAARLVLSLTKELDEAKQTIGRLEGRLAAADFSALADHRDKQGCP